MKKSLLTIFNFAAGFLVCFFIVSQFSFDTIKTTSGKTEKVISDQWNAPRLPTTLSFAGEQVPLNYWDVKERLDRELLFNYYWQNNILYMLKMSNRYFPIIETRLKANGVPDDFKYLCIAESNLFANATSRAGAVGFWQFMPETAPAYKLEVNKQIDTRRHLVQSTDAACKYLKAAYEKFGTWTAAAASYNCGQGGYAKQATIQKTKNYYDLLLPDETNRYVFRILALKHLMENAKELGFVLEKEELYDPIPTRAITITESIPDIAQFAINNGTNYKILKLLNPWLRSNDLSIKQGKSYEILLPK